MNTSVSTSETTTEFAGRILLDVAAVLSRLQTFTNKLTGDAQGPQETPKGFNLPVNIGVAQAVLPELTRKAQLAYSDIQEIHALLDNLEQAFGVGA